MDDQLVTLTVVFAATSSAAGFALSLIAWELFRGAPFGRMMGFLSAILFVLTVQHSLHLAFETELTSAVETVAFVALLVWVILMIRQHQRLSRRPEVTEEW